MKNDHSSHGYTLLEVLISLTIVIGIVGGGVAAFRNFDTRQQIVNSSRKLEIELRAVQKKAQSGEKPTALECQGNTLDGWELAKATDNDYQYITRARCNGSVAEGSQTIHNLTSGVTFANTNFQVQFEVLTGKASQNTTIELRSGSKTQRIQVTTAGGINRL